MCYILDITYHTHTCSYFFTHTLPPHSPASGVLVPGGFGSRGVEGKVAAVRWAREQRVPFLGVCLGLQVITLTLTLTLTLTPTLTLTLTLTLSCRWL